MNLGEGSRHKRNQFIRSLYGAYRHPRRSGLGVPMLGTRKCDTTMRRILAPSVLLSLLCVVSPVQGQDPAQSDSDYLQQRSATLNDRIDIAVKDRKLSKKAGAKLHASVGRVQTLAGNLQTRNGTISRADADRMNQQLTDVERTLTHQPK